jgi:hypothetical protein
MQGVCKPVRREGLQLGQAEIGGFGVQIGLRGLPEAVIDPNAHAPFATRY